MEYSDEDVAFAFRLLNERESLDDAEVEEWMKSPVHRRLMNDMEGVRQEWEANTGAEPERTAREEKSRRMTLRWTIALVVIMLALLAVSRVAWT